MSSSNMVAGGVGMMNDNEGHGSMGMGVARQHSKGAVSGADSGGAGTRMMAWVLCG